MTDSLRLSGATSSRPRNCVRQYPVVGGGARKLVGFDAEGIPRIEIKVSEDEPLEQWEASILRWLRRRAGRRLALVT